MKLLNQAKYDEHLKRERSRIRILRAKKRAAANGEDAEIDFSAKVVERRTFSCKQTLNRSVSKVEKSLPKNPGKKTEVIRSLASKYKLRIEVAKRGRKEKILSNDRDI